MNNGRKRLRNRDYQRRKQLENNVATQQRQAELSQSLYNLSGDPDIAQFIKSAFGSDG